jgi:hypothetical protein
MTPRKIKSPTGTGTDAEAAPIGDARDVTRYQERLGEPIEAAILVDTGRAEPWHRFAMLVLTATEFHLIEPHWPLHDDELLCVPYGDIADINHERKFVANGAFWLTFANGSHLSLRAFYGDQGRDAVVRLAQLIARHAAHR